jgi:hypothetical protein
MAGSDVDHVRNHDGATQQGPMTLSRLYAEIRERGLGRI